MNVCHTYISDAAEGTDGGCPVLILAACHVLGEGGGDDDGVLGDVT